MVDGVICYERRAASQAIRSLPLEARRTAIALDLGFISSTVGSKNIQQSIGDTIVTHCLWHGTTEIIAPEGGSTCQKKLNRIVMTYMNSLRFANGELVHNYNIEINHARKRKSSGTYAISSAC